ncbi:MAG: hypothetical protein EP307_06455 [Rhodobacteraceae bacterium]|nr:MAG: hypothetical protein EP307_06455 [Paracoccaceae bacterium]
MHRPFLPFALVCLVSACTTPATSDRADEWRAILAREAPIGSPAVSVEQALARRGIAASRGTYVTVGDDGVTRSNCPDPKAAVTGAETEGRIGFNSNVIEITACLDKDGRVLSHHVGVWIQ